MPMSKDDSNDEYMAELDPVVQDEPAGIVENEAEVPEVQQDWHVAEPIEVHPEPVVEAPIPPAPVITPHATAVVGNDATDPVSLAACVYKNPYARKSLTVHHLQRRLNELGYTDANADLDGWYGDLTKNAVAKFQESNGMDASGLMDMVTLEKIFSGDPNVHVVA